jgi:predicted Zn-dependent protease
MGGFFGQGIWIFLLLFLGCALYCAWLLHRKLADLRDRGLGAHAELGEVLLRHRLGVNRMEEAAALMETGKVDEAIARLMEVRDTVPGLHPVDFFLGKAYLAKGDLPRAAEHLRSFLDRARPYDRLTQERLAEARSLLESMPPPA